MTTLDGLLRQLTDLAGKPLGQATGLPPELYRRADVLELERERIFARDWLCAGLAADIPSPGDYLTHAINDQPVFVVRGHDGQIRGFSNVCLHRMMRLVEGRGSCRTIVCPYHAWSYDLGGRLVGAPHMKDVAGFLPADHRLPGVRTEVWEGWIYVTLDPSAPSIGELLAPLRDLVSRYELAAYVPIVTQDAVWSTDWKLLTENFMESYHVPVTHRKTLGSWLPLDDIEFPAETHAGFTYEIFTKGETARYGRAHPSNIRLEGRWRYTTVMPTVYPSHMFVAAPDHLWYLSLRPRAVGEVHVRFGVALAPEVLDALEDREAFTRETVAFFDQVNNEDRYVVEGIYDGARAPLARAGRRNWLEHELHDFAGYLARRLAGRPGAEAGQPEAARRILTR
jgi:phenylpropionate dioxygenase-like ring-hydroxylating dioxygenase large terminal subunit